MERSVDMKYIIHIKNCSEPLYLHTGDLIVVSMVPSEAAVPPPFRNLSVMNGTNQTSGVDARCIYVFHTTER